VHREPGKLALIVPFDFWMEELGGDSMDLLRVYLAPVGDFMARRIRSTFSCDIARPVSRRWTDESMVPVAARLRRDETGRAI